MDHQVPLSLLLILHDRLLTSDSLAASASAAQSSSLMSPFFFQFSVKRLRDIAPRPSSRGDNEALTAPLSTSLLPPLLLLDVWKEEPDLLLLFESPLFSLALFPTQRSSCPFPGRVLPVWLVRAPCLVSKTSGSGFYSSLKATTPFFFAMHLQLLSFVTTPSTFSSPLADGKCFSPAFPSLLRTLSETLLWISARSLGACFELTVIFVSFATPEQRFCLYVPMCDFAEADILLFPRSGPVSIFTPALDV